MEPLKFLFTMLSESKKLFISSLFSSGEGVSMNDLMFRISLRG